jgi:uncharacterized protein YdeI (YjbR/CyaY-like superfamily)
VIPTDRYPKVQVESVGDLRAWLEANYDREDGVWLVRFKKKVPAKFADRLDVLDELLCFGWVDGIARKLDDERTMQLITPRRQQAWAQSYKIRVARLVTTGRMRPPGLAAIRRSKELGLWDAYEAVDSLAVPEDVERALAAFPSANAWFASAAPSYRLNVHRWIHSAKKCQTRNKRVGELVSASRTGVKLAQM